VDAVVPGCRIVLMLFAFSRNANDFPFSIYSQSALLWADKDSENSANSVATFCLKNTPNPECFE
jgi:hypothetical protein